jgi:hypothetical protein
MSHGLQKTALGYIAGMGRISGGEGSPSYGYSNTWDALEDGMQCVTTILAVPQRLQFQHVDTEISRFHYGMSA